jgi:hypothetical protein
VLHFLSTSLTRNATFFVSNGSTAPWGPKPPHFSRLHDHTLFGHTTLSRTPLNEWPARRRDLYLTTLTRDRHPCLRWDSNPQSQQASGRRPTKCSLTTAKYLTVLSELTSLCTACYKGRSFYTQNTYLHTTTYFCLNSPILCLFNARLRLDFREEPDSFFYILSKRPVCLRPT